MILQQISCPSMWKNIVISSPGVLGRQQILHRSILLPCVSALLRFEVIEISSYSLVAAGDQAVRHVCIYSACAEAHAEYIQTCPKEENGQNPTVSVLAA